MNKNIFSELSAITDDNKTYSAVFERGTKRAATEQSGGEVKRQMLDHHSHKEQVSNLNANAFDKPMFVSAAEFAAHARTSSQAIPEISDEELLKMAIEFEKKHPQ
ncbi:unnamed protein product [Adineta ricciae]|uniref:Uncharacterized protein n=1 Tax=Adineta ricciae TaxID=249248 RepID=A0A815KHM3_ADIRI|nr:unnamed protein product [Adineta ricciae]CAF1393432.1 unnamed protein product [Adineta ricciae]